MVVSIDRTFSSIHQQLVDCCVVGFDRARHHMLLHQAAKIQKKEKHFQRDDEARNLRFLFLDRSVTDYDRAIWIGFISNQIGTAQLANVLLLLYAPIDAQGKIDWHFAFHVSAFEQHTYVFVKLAKTIGILQLIPNWSPYFSLEVLVWISNVRGLYRCYHGCDAATHSILISLE
ncbi:uncharacterized protein LOC124320439 [Daphnia pulicaria]|uniref:uncharacterized protein LOC124320439 n=1 Tax=Daphnia pulicaria TaxID=35523 RepID=UPI001EEC3796|nr:uncharacterized protein LOC124320439 [Daphnia pulicaria]